MERQLIVPALARPLHGETNGRLYSAARWFRKKRRRGPLSAQQIAAVALFHRLVGVHEVLAVGGGVARVRDELHGAPAEIGLVVVGLGAGVRLPSGRKCCA